MRLFKMNGSRERVRSFASTGDLDSWWELHLQRIKITVYGRVAGNAWVRHSWDRRKVFLS